MYTCNVSVFSNNKKYEKRCNFKTKKLPLSMEKKERKHDFSLLKFFNTLSQYCFEFENFIILTASMYDV